MFDPPSPLNPIFTFYNPIFWDPFRPPSPPKIGHHLCTIPKETGQHFSMHNVCVIIGTSTLAKIGSMHCTNGIFV